MQLSELEDVQIFHNLRGCKSHILKGWAPRVRRRFQFATWLVASNVKNEVQLIIKN